VVIAKRLKRSRAVIKNFLHDPEGYGTRKRSERKPRFTASEMLAIMRVAHRGEMSANDLRRNLRLPIGVRRVKQILATNDQGPNDRREP